ncbi:hypothetical protein CsSME_00037098 [Camellia sinensis var. sinensis]
MDSAIDQMVPYGFTKDQVIFVNNETEKAQKGRRDAKRQDVNAAMAPYPHTTLFYLERMQRTDKPGWRGPWHTYKCLASQLLSATKSTGLRVVSSKSSEAMALAVGQEGSSQDSTAASLASQQLSAIKSTGLRVAPYFTNDPSNHKDHYSGSKVESDDVESAGLTNSPTAISTTSSQTHSPSSSSSTPSHPISITSQKPNFQSETQTQTHLSNPIAKAFRELEMGKSFLTFILPTATMILALHGKDSSPGVLYSILCLLCAALVALLYGISLRDLFPGIANSFEQLGIAFIYTSFFVVLRTLNPPKSKNIETFEEGDDGAFTYLTPTPRSLNLQSFIDDRRGEQSTRKPANQSSRHCRCHHFLLDSSPVINLNTSDITGGLETSQQFRWWFGQMLSTCDQLQEKDDA